MASFNRGKNVGNAVVICFLDAGSSAVQDHWLNRAAEWIAPRTINEGLPKIHCEILFPSTRESLGSDSRNGESCSIAFNGEVFLIPKQFTRDQWTFRILKEVSAETYQDMKTFCRNCKGDRFNHLGYGLFGLTSGLIRLSGTWTQHFHPMRRRWFCSEIVIEALKIGHYLPFDLSSVQHPETLHQLIIPQSSAGMVKFKADAQLLV